MSDITLSKESVQKTGFRCVFRALYINAVPRARAIRYWCAIKPPEHTRPGTYMYAPHNSCRHCETPQLCSDCERSYNATPRVADYGGSSQTMRYCVREADEHRGLPYACLWLSIMPLERISCMQSMIKVSECNLFHPKTHSHHNFVFRS